MEALVGQQESDRIKKHAVLRRRNQRGAFKEQKKRATPTTVKQGEERQVVASSDRLMGHALGQNPIGLFPKQRFDQGQSFLPRALGVRGRIKTSQWGSNQNQPLFSFKPVIVILARGDLNSRQIQR
jgi:hypothetical protein